MDLKARLKKLEQIAINSKTRSHSVESCICFPRCEPVNRTATERTVAEELQCPLHGRRLPIEIYRSKWLKKAPPLTRTAAGTHTA